MSKFGRALLGASLLGLAAATAATPASAQRITRIVTFGDSYADTGNLFPLAGLNPLTFQNGIYSTGRFSGGTNYIDTLSKLLNAPVENFAVGGATAVRGSASAFDLQFEVDNFLNVGTQAPVFPNGAPSFGPNDLVTVSIGGNDARYFQQGLNNGRTVADSIAATNTQLNRLVGAGAKTFSVLAGNTALLPEVATNPAAQATRQTFSNTYNAAVQAQLAGYAANGVVVHYLDLTQVLASIQANPAAFGVPNGVVCPATQQNVITGCAGYVFYVDALHLSSDGFRVVGRYVAAQLKTPLVLGSTLDVQLDTARQLSRTLEGRVDTSGPRAGVAAPGLHLVALGDAFQRKVQTTSQSDRFNIQGFGAMLGLEYGFDGGVFGVAGGLSRDHANFVGDPFKVRGKTVQVGAYGGLASGGLFVQGHLGYGRTSNDLTRAGVVNPLTADPKGHHWVAGAKAGYLADMGGLKVGPFAALDYANARVNGYTETGDGALSLNVGRQSVKALVGDAGLEARGTWNTGSVPLRPFLAVSAEKLFSGDTRGFTFAQTSAPTIVNSWNLDPRSKKIYGRITGGASAAAADNVSFDIQLGTTVAKKEGNEVNGQLGLRVAF